MKRLRAPLVLACLALCACLLAGCGPSASVHLYPVKASGGTVPSPSSITVTVVRPADERLSTSLGERSMGGTFEAVEDPLDWVGHGIVDAVRAKGYQVTYAASDKEAAAGRAQCVITGAIKGLTIRQPNPASIEAIIIVKYRVAREGRHVATETLTASQTKATMPTDKALQELLQDTLWDVVAGVADKVAAEVK